MSPFENAPHLMFSRKEAEGDWEKKRFHPSIVLKVVRKLSPAVFRGHIHLVVTVVVVATVQIKVSTLCYLLLRA